MFSNYLKVALRNILRHKASSLINVIGLSIGISASLVVYLIVQYEFSFDKFHRDSDRVYRVVTKVDFAGVTGRTSGVPMPLAEGVKETVSGVAEATHFLTTNNTKVTVPEAGKSAPSTFKQQRDIIYADSDYFKFFDYHWLAGSPTSALVEPFRVVLTASRAKLYFPEVSPVEVVSRHLIYDDSITVSVSGVVEDLNEVSDLTFREFISMGTVERTGLKDRWGWGEWGNTSSASQFFARLMPGVSPSSVEKQLAQLRDKHRENADQKDDMQHFLQPLSDIHFNADYGTFGIPQVHKPTLYGLIAIAIFLLLIGCINFVNLATAQAAQRAKEIGIRKTLGSSRRQLVMQFLGESFLLTLFAVTVSLAFAEMLLDAFRDFIPAGVSHSSVLQVHVWFFLGLLTVAVTLLSGVYPAFVHARFQPAAILRNQAFAGGAATQRAWLRKTLTVAQFAIAQFLVIATILVSKQILFSLNADLGYRRDAIVGFQVPSRFSSGQRTGSPYQEDSRRFALLNRLRGIPEIAKISLAGAPPASTGRTSAGLKVDNGRSVVEAMVEVKNADTNYFNLYEMKLVAGRNLLPSDTTKEYVINETYARLLGFSRPEEALGHFVQGEFSQPIVGVLADFHTGSMRAAINPLAYSASANTAHTFHLALRSGDLSSWKRALDKSEQAFKEVYPDQDFDARFFDETIESFYKVEQNTSRLLNWAAGLAVFISCLGLLGLAIHTTNSRRKEIGVRKVLGASVTGIVALLSKDFLAPVLVAFVLAAPAGWWVMREWLNDFAYRTAISWWVFALAGALAIVIALLAVGIQALKTATANPVDSLRYE